MTTVNMVPDDEMPQMFQAADRASLGGQRSYVMGIQIRLAVLVVAAVLGVSSFRVSSHGIDVLALLSVVGFVTALLIEVLIWRTRPDRAWYDGRAVAESVKTLAWKFAVCAHPFPRSMPEVDAIRTFIAQSDRIRSQFGELQLEPVDAPAVSPWMKRQRLSSLSDRQNSYIEARINDQKRWYTRAAKYNKKRTKQWRATLISFELIGAASSLFLAVYPTGFSIAGVVTSATAAVIAWTETKQHDSNSRAYSAAVTDLSNADAKLVLATAEDDWAQEVDDAEEAISREHVVWLATRSRI